MEGRGYDWMENGMPYNYASRHDRLEMQRKNGTSYEAQHISKIYDLASLSGYRNQQGQNIIFGNGGLGYWEKNPISGYEYLTGSDFMNAPQNVSYYTNEQLARILFPSNEDWISLSVGEKHANRNALVGSRAGESINGRGQVYNTPRSGDNSGVEFSNNVMNVAMLFFPIGRIATAAKIGIEAANGLRITGFTGHGVNRAIGSVGRSGVKPGAILDALKNPLRINNVVADQLGRQSQRFIGQFGEVVVNPQTGRIISVNPTSSSKAAKLLKQLGQ